MVSRLMAVSTALLLGLGTAMAQPAKSGAKDAPIEAPKPVEAPVSSTPERTTASFGDWILRCETAGGSTKKACEVALILTAQGQSAPIAQVAVGKGSAEGRPVTVVLPHNVSLTSKPRIVFAKTTDAPVEFSWQRCTPGACFATASLSDAAVKTLAAQVEAGKIMYKAAGEQDIVLPLSFRGLAQSLDAMAKGS